MRSHPKGSIQLKSIKKPADEIYSSFKGVIRKVCFKVLLCFPNTSRTIILLSFLAIVYLPKCFFLRCKISFSGENGLAHT